MIKGLYFDFDGTISDARRIAYESLIKTLEEFKYSYDKKKASKLLGWKMVKIFEGLNLPKKDLNRFRKRFYERFTAKALNGGIKLCVSVKPLYELSKKYPLVIVSNSETSFVKASIKKLKLNKLFSQVYGSEKFTSKDKLLKKLFSDRKVKNEEMLYIGDRFSDIEYARSAGCIAVAVHNSCSWSTLKEIKRERPDYIIKDFYGLKKLVEKLNNQ